MDGHFGFITSKARLLAAAAICIACRTNNSSISARTLTEIAAISDENKSAIHKLTSKLCLDLKIEHMGRVSAEGVVPRLTALVVGLSSNSAVTEMCRQTCSNLCAAELLDGTPPAVVAAVSVLMTVMAYNHCSADYVKNAVVANGGTNVGSSSSSSGRLQSASIDVGTCVPTFADFVGVTAANLLKTYSRVVCNAGSVLPGTLLASKSLRMLSPETLVKCLSCPGTNRSDNDPVAGRKRSLDKQEDIQGGCVGDNNGAKEAENRAGITTQVLKKRSNSSS
jgi:hypothetical protein